MCEFTSFQNKNNAFNYAKRKSPFELLPDNIFSKFPYALTEGYCPKCGIALTFNERKPIGRATRSMCNSDFNRLIANNSYGNCFMCDIPLPRQKVHVQRENPKEIAAYLHDGDCKSQWSLIHNVAVGEPDFVNLFGRNNERIQGFLDDDETFYCDNFLLENDPTPNPILNQPFGSENVPSLIHRAEYQMPQRYKGKPVRVIPMLCY